MIKKMLALLLLSVSLLLIPAHPGYCWDKVAHMIISQIAYDRLTPTAKAKVDALALALNSDPLTIELPDDEKPFQGVSIAAWPDDLRGLKAETRSFSPWHYIDIPDLPAAVKMSPGPNGMPPIPIASAADIAVVKAFPAGDESNVYDAIVNKCEFTLKDPNSTVADQARMLAFLTHFVGDIHQPLHASGKLLGGNHYDITELAGADPTWRITNLHSFWDNAWRYDTEDGQILVEGTLDTPRPAPETGTIKSMADAIEANCLTTDPRLLNQTDPAAWAVESNNLATTVAYAPGMGHTLTLDYIHTARQVALERLALAGYRLGNLLNQLLSGPQ